MLPPIAVIITSRNESPSIHAAVKVRCWHISTPVNWRSPIRHKRPRCEIWTHNVSPGYISWAEIAISPYRMNVNRTSDPDSNHHGSVRLRRGRRSQHHSQSQHHQQTCLPHRITSALHQCKHPSQRKVTPQSGKELSSDSDPTNMRVPRPSSAWAGIFSKL